MNFAQRPIHCQATQNCNFEEAFHPCTVLVNLEFCIGHFTTSLSVLGAGNVETLSRKGLSTLHDVQQQFVQNFSIGGENGDHPLKWVGSLKQLWLGNGMKYDTSM